MNNFLLNTIFYILNFSKRLMNFFLIAIIGMYAFGINFTIVQYYIIIGFISLLIIYFFVIKHKHNYFFNAFKKKKYNIYKINADIIILLIYILFFSFFSYNAIFSIFFFLLFYFYKINSVHFEYFELSIYFLIFIYCLVIFFFQIKLVFYPLLLFLIVFRITFRSFYKNCLEILFNTYQKYLKKS